MVKRTFKSAVKRTNIKKSILGVLGGSKKPLSTTEVASKTGKSWHTVLRYCMDLEIDGKVSKFEIGRINVWQIKR